MGRRPRREQRETPNEQPQPPDPAPEPPSAPIVAGQPYTGPSLAEFAGAAAARTWGEQLVADLKAYKAGRITWKDVDRGAVFHGPPGTGKTMFAHALALAAGVPLIVTSYHQWMSRQDGHQGSMMQAMRLVFEKAAKEEPAIIFIDELDSLPSRASAREHKDWYVAAVNSLLELLDGSNRRQGVVVIGACNDITRIDEGLLRSGRLERQIEFTLPTLAEAAQILAFHSGARLEPSELERIAVAATGATGAELENIARAARRAARQEDRPVTADDLLTVAIGPIGIVPPAILRRAAVHEAGHALVAIRLGVAGKVTASIARRGAAIGTTRLERTPADRTRQSLEDEMAVDLAGRAAEDLLLGNISPGSGGGGDSDLARATGTAVHIATALGFSEAGGLVWHPEHVREQILLSQPHIAAEIQQLLDRCYARALETLRRERPALERLAAALEKHRALRDADVIAIIELGGDPPLLH